MPLAKRSFKRAPHGARRGPFLRSFVSRLDLSRTAAAAAVVIKDTAMGPGAAYFVTAGIVTGGGVTTIVWWLASRRGAARDIIARAEEHARLFRSQAERDAETLRKEAI